MSARSVSPTYNTRRKVSFGERKRITANEDFEDDNGVITLDDDEHANGENEAKDAEKRNNELVSGVSVYDYETLEEGEYINDAIIEFYLNWLFRTKLDKSKREDIHIFSTHFYSKLTSKLKRRADENGRRSHESNAYECVKKWTKKIDLFSKRMIVFPICEESHWYVIIVCNPGSINKTSEDQIIRGSPYFLVLDSLGDDHHADAVSALRFYLKLEFENKRKENVVHFSKDKMPEKLPDIPVQHNSCDCGVFLLHYVELIFEDPSQFYWPSKIGKLSHWFTEKDIQHKREEIASLIQTMAKKNSGSKHISFPELTFLRRSSRRREARKDKRVAAELTAAQAASDSDILKRDCDRFSDMAPEDFAKQVLTSSGRFKDRKELARKSRSSLMDNPSSPCSSSPERREKSTRDPERGQADNGLRHKRTSDNSEPEASPYFRISKDSVSETDNSPIFDRTNPLCRKGGLSLKSYGRTREKKRNESGTSDELSVHKSNPKRFKLVRTNLPPSL